MQEESLMGVPSLSGINLMLQRYLKLTPTQLLIIHQTIDPLSQLKLDREIKLPD